MQDRMRLLVLMNYDAQAYRCFSRKLLYVATQQFEGLP